MNFREFHGKSVSEDAANRRFLTTGTPTVSLRGLSYGAVLHVGISLGTQDKTDSGDTVLPVLSSG